MPRPSLEIGTYGTISAKRTPSGSWRALARMRDQDGYTRQVSATGTTKEKAKNALKLRLRDRQVAGQGEVNAEMTLSELGEFWLKRVRATGDLQETTLDRYGRTVELLSDAFGGVRLRELTVAKVDSVLFTFQEQSQPSGRRARTVLNMMLSLAARLGAIPSNPVASLERMKGAKTTVRVLKPGDISAVRTAIHDWQGRPRSGPRDKDLADIVDLHLATGCRIGEVLALRWMDIDFEGNRLFVTGTLQTVPETGLVRRPTRKADSALTLFLPEFAMAVLRRRLEASRGSEEDPVFPSRKGTWKSPHNVRRQWRAAREGTGLEWVTPHTFRKTVGSLVKKRTDLGSASSQLGHSSERVTEQHYVEKETEAPDLRSVLEELGPQPESD